MRRSCAQVPIAELAQATHKFCAYTLPLEVAAGALPPRRRAAAPGRGTTRGEARRRGGQADPRYEGGADEAGVAPLAVSGALTFALQLTTVEYQQRLEAAQAQEAAASGFPRNVLVAGPRPRPPAVRPPTAAAALAHYLSPSFTRRTPNGNLFGDFLSDTC